MRTGRNKLQKLVIGVLIAASGVILLLFKTEVLPAKYKDIVFSWQMLLIAIGFISLFRRSYPKIFFGLALILIGGFFMVTKFDWVGFSFIKENVWAVMLIFLGIAVLIHTLFNKRIHAKWHKKHVEEFHKRHAEHFHKREWYSKTMPQNNELGYAYHNYVFGGSKEKPQYDEFKGGEINCVFGGMELDLTQCQLTEGVSNLSINTVFGGAVLYMPIDWKVELRQESVFGHFEDKRPKPTFEIDNNKILIITASCVFGGGEIKTKTV